MALTVTIADNLDGTGGVATVAGSTVGSTNTLYRAEFRGHAGPSLFASAGTRTSDGTITLSTGPMRTFYLWYVKSVSGAVESVSPVVCQALTDESYEAVRTRLIAAVIDTLKLLGLEGIDDSAIVFRADEQDPCQQWPAAMVLFDPTPDVYAGGTNIRDDLGYGIKVAFQDRSDRRSGANVDKWARWRELGERAFRNQRLTGVSESVTCFIEPSVTADPAPPIYEQVVSSFTIRAVCREVRGIAA